MKHKPKDTKKVKTNLGRPVENIIEPINATPLAVAKAIMQGPMKKTVGVPGFLIKRR